MIRYHCHVLLVTALLCLILPHPGDSRLSKNIDTTTTEGFITYPVSPTTHLFLKNKDEEEYNRRLESLEGQSFINNHAMYGKLEEKLVENNPKMKDMLRNELKKFNKHRHLSRFSRKRRNNRNLSVNTFQIAPLLQGFGTHYVTAWVGTPPQRTSLIVDTGSRFTVFPCKGCQNCGEENHTDKYFDLDKSSTSKVANCMECDGDDFYCSEDQCHFGISYAEGSSWDAYLVSDKFFLGSNGYNSFTNPKAANNAVTYSFGCQTHTEGLFVQQLADGTMGLAAHKKSLHHTLYDEKKLLNREYSVCFGYSLEVTKKGVYAGIMTLGGSNDKLHDHSMVYARDFKDHGWYTVYLRKMYLCDGMIKVDDYDFHGHNPLELDFNPEVVNSDPGAIIDSGTTDMYFPKEIFESFKKKWLELVGKEYTEDAFYATEEEVKALPALVLQLSGMEEFNAGKTLGTAHKIDAENPNDVVITVPPTYFIERDDGGYDDWEDKLKETRTDGRVRWVSRIFFHDDDGAILGASSIRGYDVHFDVDNHRVGFARSDCNYQKRVLEDPELKNMQQTAYPTDISHVHENSHSSLGSTLVTTPRRSSDYDDDLFQFGDDDTYNLVKKSKKCKLGKLEVFAPCWESVTNFECESSQKAKSLEGLETYRASIIDSAHDVFGSCESVGYDYSDNVSLVQCFDDKYCDLVLKCTTSCATILSQGNSASLPSNNLDNKEDKCTLGKLEVFAPCWESVSSELCDNKDKSKRLSGLETYRASILDSKHTDEFGSCEHIGYDYSKDVSLVQCFNDKYCDLVFQCTTDCDAVSTQGRSSTLAKPNFVSSTETSRMSFQGALEQPQLAMKGILSNSKKHIYNLVYYGVTLLLILGIVSIALSVLNGEDSIFNRCIDKSKNGDYSRLATIEKFADDDDSSDGDCEMKSLLTSGDKKKNKKRISKKNDTNNDGLQNYEEDNEELSLFDEVLEDNKNYFGEYAPVVDDNDEESDDEQEKEEEEEENEESDEDGEFVPLTKH